MSSSLVPSSKQDVERRMRELSEQYRMPPGSWYVMERKQPDGRVEWIADWTKIGLTYLVQMDDRVVRCIDVQLEQSALSEGSKGTAIAVCLIMYMTGAWFRCRGRANIGEFKGQWPTYHADDIAETRALKRTAVIATAKALIDHPLGMTGTGEEEEEE
jgi:hypothetical protein